MSERCRDAHVVDPNVLALAHQVVSSVLPMTANSHYCYQQTDLLIYVLCVFLVSRALAVPLSRAKADWICFPASSVSNTC